MTRARGLSGSMLTEADTDIRRHDCIRECRSDTACRAAWRSVARLAFGKRCKPRRKQPDGVALVDSRRNQSSRLGASLRSEDLEPRTVRTSSSDPCWRDERSCCESRSRGPSAYDASVGRRWRRTIRHLLRANRQPLSMTGPSNAPTTWTVRPATAPRHRGRSTRRSRFSSQRACRPCTVPSRRLEERRSARSLVLSASCRSAVRAMSGQTARPSYFAGCRSRRLYRRPRGASMPRDPWAQTIHHCTENACRPRRLQVPSQSFSIR